MRCQPSFPRLLQGLLWAAGGPGPLAPVGLPATGPLHSHGLGSVDRPPLAQSASRSGSTGGGQRAGSALQRAAPWAEGGPCPTGAAGLGGEVLGHPVRRAPHGLAAMQQAAEPDGAEFWVRAWWEGLCPSFCALTSVPRPLTAGPWASGSLPRRKPAGLVTWRQRWLWETLTRQTPWGTRCPSASALCCG